MRPWKLGLGHPLSLTLAADARLSPANYVNDQIWRLSLSGGEPPAFALNTTYGLRSRGMRLFPRFWLSGQMMADPSQFYQPPQVELFYPNYISVSMMPFSGIVVHMDYWCPESDVVCGRIRLRNQSMLPASLRLDWVAQLNPLGEEGHPMGIETVDLRTILRGRTANLWPVCVMSGTPLPANLPFSALTQDVELPHGGRQDWTWACAALTDTDESLEKARQALIRPWEAEVARIELQNAAEQVQIETGDPDWDAAFALSQKVALGLFFPASECLPEPSFVLSREPEHGHSIRGNGTDYPYLWNGQTALDAYYLKNVLLTGSVERVKGVLLNFLAAQAEDGWIDWKPGIMGQRSQRLAQPLLASLAREVAEQMDDRVKPFLQQVYPGLIRFIQVWFRPQFDRDGDGFPEFAHPVQSGLEETPMFDRWHPSAQGVDISTIESPALAAMLLSECRSLIWIAQQINEKSDLPWLEEKCQLLLTLLQECWDEKSRTYRYRDYLTHQTRPAEILLEFEGAATFPVDRRWRHPRRLALTVSANESSTYVMQGFIRGDTPNGPVEEKINSSVMYWNGGTGRYTTQNAFTRVKKLEIQTLVNFKGSLKSIGYTQQDISLSLPLWAGAPEPEQADHWIHSIVSNHYVRPFGLPVCHPDSCGEDASAAEWVSLPWNSFVIEGLLRYGYRAEAAGLFTRLMQAITDTLKETQGFRASYNAVTGSGSREVNSLHGLAPVHLFLRTAGISKLTPHEIVLEGSCPFPWPFTLKFRGIVVQWKGENWTVQFRNGQSVKVTGPERHTVSLH